MRRALALLLLTAPLALLLAGCGGEVVSATPETVVGTVAVPTTTSQGAALPPGKAEDGKAVYVSASCGACHVMAAANSKGEVGPNLDELKVDLQRIQEQVINGGGGMPPYKGQLTNQQIADVSLYVFESTN